MGKFLPTLIWIHSQNMTPKRKAVIVFKQPSYGRSLLAAPLISGVLNRLRDYSCGQSLVWICPPLDLREEPGFYRNGHFGSYSVHNPHDSLSNREGVRGLNINNCSHARQIKGNHLSNCNDHLRSQKNRVRAAQDCEAQTSSSEKQASGSFLRSLAEKQLGQRAENGTICQKLRKEPQVNEETEEELEKLALDLNDCLNVAY